jgi:hypothetical protein
MEDEKQLQAKIQKHKEWLESLKQGDEVVLQHPISYWKHSNFKLSKVLKITEKEIIVSDNCYRSLPRDTGVLNDSCINWTWRILPYTDELIYKDLWNEGSPLSTKYIVEYHRLLRKIKEFYFADLELEQLIDIENIIDSR